MRAGDPTRADQRVPARRRPSAVAAAVGYAAIFAVCSAPWLRAVTHAIPISDSAPADDRLVMWSLAWVAHALVAAPAHLLDGNIFHPAPRQLTGSEHFGSSELVFAPVFWLTGNAVLAASAVTLVSYPLAALLTNRLAVALGCGAGAAWVAGLVLALGPLQVPASLHGIQYLVLYLPAVALALTRLRERPTVGRAIVLGATELVAFFSSYYMAVIAAVTGAAWGAVELARPLGRRGRFAALAVSTSALALGVLALVSRAYLHRSGGGPPATGPGPAAYLLVARRFADADGLTLAGLAVGAVAFALGRRTERGVALRGLLLALLALCLVSGPGWRWGDVVIPLPLAVLQATPGRFFRYSFRFMLVLGLGLALLVGAGVETATRRWPGLGPAIVVLATAALLMGRGRALVGRGVASVEGETAAVYPAIGALASAPRAEAVLVLPVIVPTADRMLGTQADAMVGSTRAWFPLVDGFTGYPPPHRALVLDAVGRLPDADALGEIVDMTHARWLVLYPPERWPQPAVRSAIAAMPELVPVVGVGGYDILRIARAPAHPSWYDGIERGVDAGTTLLGTPLVPIADADARASVSGRWPAVVYLGRPLGVDVVVRNEGRTTWPVAVAPADASAPVVALDVRWWTPADPHDDAHAVVRERLALRRDVPGGEALRQRVLLATPPVAGRYDVEVGVRQAGGARFDGPGNVPLDASVTVLAP